MPVFYCRVINKAGQTSEFMRDAPSEDILVGELNREHIYPLKVQEVADGGTRSGRKSKSSAVAVLEFTSTMALLLSSGLTFRDALEVGQTIFLKGQVNKIVVWLLEEIRKGKSVYQAMDEFGAGLPPIFKGFIKIGEKIGSLEGAFRQLSEYMIEEKKLRDKLAGSLVYPILVLSVAVIGIAGIVVFVFPRIGQMFTEIGSVLPQRLESVLNLFNLSLVIGGFFCALILAGILTFFLVRRSSERAAEILDRFQLRLPVWGKIRSLKQMLNLLFAMETLTGGGFTVEDALLEASQVVSNRAFRSGILKARDNVIKGEDLSAAFLESPVFSERLGRWIAIGERSGQVSQVFGQLRRYYQGEIEKWSSRFMNLVEPVLILLVGIVIFMIIIFFITPIFSIYEGLF